MSRYPPGRPWLHLGAENPAPAPAGAAVWRVDLDGRRCRSERGFFATVASALTFPAYFGHNWDAFDECLADLLDITAEGMGHEFGDREGRPEDTLHLAVSHAEDLLLDADPHALHVLLSRLRDPRAIHFDEAPPRRYAGLYVTFHCTAEKLETFTTRLQAAGLRPADLS